MTLKELVMKVSFDELFPYLRAYEREHIDNLYAFREAYDMLRTTEPNVGFQGEARVEWSGGGAGVEKWIGVHCLDDDVWENELAKEIVVADDVQLSPAELAMHCLWEITYWGFSPEEITETFQEKFGYKEPVSPGEVALDKLEESIWRHQTPRRLRSRGEDGERLVRVEFPLRGKGRRPNRSKRKRAYRQGRRKDYLKKRITRENLINTLTAEGSSFGRGDVDFSLDVAYGAHYDYYSVTGGNSSRLAYILESMTRYQHLELSRYDSAVVFAFVPLKHPLGKEEVAGFKEGVRRRLGYADIRFGSIVRESTSPKVKVMLLLNKRMA